MKYKVFGKLILSVTGLLMFTSVMAQDTYFTLSKKAPLMLDLSRDSEQIGTLMKGTKVEPLAQVGSQYQVRTANNNIGWVAFNVFEESKKLIVDPFKDRPVILYKSITKGKYIWTGDEEIRELEEGEIVTYVEETETNTFIKVRDSSGRVGYVQPDRAHPIVESKVPEYEQLDYLVVLESQVQEELIQSKATVEMLTQRLRMPTAQVLNAQGDGFLYYQKLYLVKDGERYGDIRFLIKDHTVESFSYAEGPESFWIESMPLATWFRSLEIGIELQKMQNFDLLPSTAEMSFWPKWGWRLFKLIAAVLFFSIPHFIASLFMTLLGYIKSLSNLAVQGIGIITSYMLIYAYFLFLGLHMMHDQHWLLVIFAFFIMYFSTKVLFFRIEYQRCPNTGCHSFFKAEDLGSAVVGKTHVTEHKHRDVYKGTRETSTHRIKEYERQHYTEESTEIDYDDYRECTECGETWEVRRFKIVRGHV